MTPYLDNQDLDYVINCMNEFAAKRHLRLLSTNLKYIKTGN